MKLRKREGYTGEHAYRGRLLVSARCGLIWGALKTLVPAIWQGRSFNYVVHLAKPLPNGNSCISVILAIDPAQLRRLALQFEGHYHHTLGEMHLRGHRRDE